jgi:hypothetical protein
VKHAIIGDGSNEAHGFFNRAVGNHRPPIVLSAIAAGATAEALEKSVIIFVDMGYEESSSWPVSFACFEYFAVSSLFLRAQWQVALPLSIISPRRFSTKSNCPTLKPSGTFTICRKGLKNNVLHKNGAIEPQKKFPIDGGTVPTVNLLTTK